MTSPPPPPPHIFSYTLYKVIIKMHVKTQAARAQYESGAVDSYSHQLPMKYAETRFTLFHLVSSCFLCGYFPDPLRFKLISFIPIFR